MILKEVNNFSGGAVFCLLLLLAGITEVRGQSFDSLRKPKLTGSFMATDEVYSVRGIENRALPHNYSVAANVNLNVQDFNLPFSFYYSKQDNRLFQPFNQFGIRPSYKWVKLHLGYCNLSLSPYTLTGRTFLGSAVELTPYVKGAYQLKLVAFYGRLNRAVEVGLNSLSTPSFERRTYGTSVGVIKNGDEVNLSLFRANDDESSLNMTDNPDLTPENNIVMEAFVKKRLIKKLTATVDYAYSGLTSNTLSEGGKSPNGIIDVLYNTQSSTMFGSAFNSTLNYEFGHFNLGAGYQLVGKDFTSLGINYLQTDYSQTTINGSARFLKNTGYVNVSGGIQNSNLSNTMLASTQRYIFNINYNQSIKRMFRYGLIFSNNSLSNKVTSDYATDSLNFYMVMSNYGANLSYTFGNKTVQTISLYTSYQTGLQQREYGLASTATDFVFATLSDNFRIKKYQLTITPGVSYSKSTSGIFSISYFGPILNVRKTLYDGRLSLMNSFSVMQNEYNDTKGNLLVKESVNVRYSFLKKHGIGALFYLINQDNRNNSRPSFLEVKLSINYSYNF